jgi:NADPH:quinone reductase-like Zn-dependent oxidoreductase
LSQLRQVLSPTGTLVIVGGHGPGDGKWIEPLPRLLEAKLYSMFVRQKFLFFVADVTQKDLDVLRELLQSGKVMPVIDRRYPLTAVPAAIAYLEKGHARGKVVISLE